MIERLSSWVIAWKHPVLGLSRKVVVVDRQAFSQSGVNDAAMEMSEDETNS
jgi:hypothetical protein